MILISCCDACGVQSMLESNCPTCFQATGWCASHASTQALLVELFSHTSCMPCTDHVPCVHHWSLPDLQVHKFSKFIHGTATLLPDMIAAVPYWIDDESVRPSMLQSAGYRDIHQAE